MLQRILRNNCSTEYATYKTGERPEGSEDQSAIISPLINCIFETLTEHNKAEIAAGAVVLGLLPAILQMMGSKPPETGFLALRRPILATLLALGSPSATVVKTNDFISTARESVANEDMDEIVNWLFSQKSIILSICLGLLEYLFAIAAAANVLYLAYQLGFHAITIISPETVYMLLMWTLFCLIAHLGSLAVFEWKTRFIRDDVMKLWEEPFPVVFQTSRSLKWPEQSISSNVFIWVLSMVTLANLIFGTMIFSSLLFFSIKDVMSIVGRYIASAVVCRGILRLELSSFKKSTIFPTR